MPLTSGELVELIDAITTKQCGVGATESTIGGVGDKLGVVFPLCYRIILEKFGWLRIGSWELFGLGPDVPGYLDLEQTVALERRDSAVAIPHSLLPVMDNGGGDLYCLDLAAAGVDGDCPMRVWDHVEGLLAPIDSGLEVPAESESFCTWLAHQVEREI